MLQKIKMLAVSVSIPFQSINDFTVLKFNKIPENKVSVVSEKMEIQVNQSASPIVYKLAQPTLVSKISWSLSVTGEMTSQKTQFPEDSYFRLGLVASGSQKLSRFHRFIAADWVKKLFDLAPKDKGIDQIYFYVVADKNSYSVKQRTHPASELMKETIVSTLESGSSEVSHQLEKPLEVVALWISTDGDNTKSKFTTQINKIQLN